MQLLPQNTPDASREISQQRTRHHEAARYLSACCQGGSTCPVARQSCGSRVATAALRSLVRLFRLNSAETTGETGSCHPMLCKGHDVSRMNGRLSRSWEVGRLQVSEAEGHCSRPWGCSQRPRSPNPKSSKPQSKRV